MRKAMFPALLLAGNAAVCAQSAWEKTDGYYIVRGMVTDSITGEALPYASVSLSGEAGGVVADSKGVFEFKVPARAVSMQAAMMGYTPKTVRLRQSSHNMYIMRLSPAATDLKELVVKNKKYSKRNNPAVEFARRIRNMAEATDPRRNSNYNFKRYERITIALNDFEHSDSDAIIRRFPFLLEHVDTSEISGKPVLPVSIRETLSTNFFRKTPRREVSRIEGQRSEGVDEMVDKASMQVFMEDVLREVDLYGEDINLLQNRFVSPLGRIAPDFYKFYLTDTIRVDGEQCIVLSFYPHNKAAFGFSGHIYVPQGDSTMFIKRVDMRVPRDINLNFVDNLLISQTFDRASDGSRLKTKDDLTMELTVVPGTPSLYVRRSTVYNDHNFKAPADTTIFRAMGNTVRDDSAYVRDTVWWSNARLKPLEKNGEQRVGLLMQRLRGIPAYYWGEKIVRLFAVGYARTGNPSKFDIGPVNTFASYNSIEGLRLRAGGVTTANLNPHWFGRAMVAYGFKDHKWKYRGELEYSFNKKSYHSREFPVHSLRFTASYDLDFIGQHYYFTNPDNMFLSLKRMSDKRAIYQRVNKLEYILELQNNFSLNAEFSHKRNYATPWVPFVFGDGRTMKHFDESLFKVELRYAPGEKFYQTTSQRIPVNLDAPVFVLSHTFGPKGLLGAYFSVNKTEFSVRKRFWLSAFGYVDVYGSAGHVWGRAPYMNLLMPNANLSYTIQPESFSLLNPMEFINDTQVNWEITYWANGAILNYIPLVKRLKLREVFGFKGVWGHLSDKNNPVLNPELLQLAPEATLTTMTHTPYMEASAGLDNILRCLRLEYVWRLNYRNVPYAIDRHGLRLSLHFTF